MDSSTGGTVPGADAYAKRWEPQEDFRDIPDHVIDALCEAFESDEERREARWFDGTPVFPKRPEPKAQAQSAEAERPKALNV